MGKVLQLRQYGKGGWEATRGAIYKAITKGRDFSAGHMKGEKVDNVVGSYGRLDDKYRDSVNLADYVVYSYATPIAWHITPGPPRDDGKTWGDDYWVMPADTYSTTTSRHQGMVRVPLTFATVLDYDQDPTEETST